jgi:GLPGLI family protein
VKTIRLFLAFSLACCFAHAQVHSARITFERRTNLYKKYRNNENVRNWLKEEDRIKTEMFELFVTDTLSYFRPQASNLKETYWWLTAKNTVYQNLRDSSTYLVKTMWGEEVHLTDSLRIREWKITPSTRKIAGYECRKALWQANDSVRIYAWFSYDIAPSSGPETFNGLPGTILGLATEDGGVVYFAKNVEVVTHPPALLVIPHKKKIHNITELKARLKKDYGHEKWFPDAFYQQFGIW